MKRMAQTVLFAALLVSLALALPHEAQSLAYTWNTVTVDAAGNAGRYTSVAVDANGDPMISYVDSTMWDLKFAVCDMSASTSGNCDQPGDWSTATVDAEGDVGRYTSIALDANGDPVISYFDNPNTDVKFAMCDLSASTNGNCDQPGDWRTATVDGEGEVGTYTSVAVDASGYPLISYQGSLRFATASPPLPVGGIAELPDVSDSSSPNYIALAALAAAALVALSAGAWYARRRWLS